MADYRNPYHVEPDTVKTPPQEAEREVLVIDDDDLVMDSMRLLLSHHGYGVATARNGFEALEMLDERPYSLILCDIRMPGLSGIDTVKAMRSTAKLEENRKIPVIFMTGYADVDIDKEAKGLKLLAFLRKPIHDHEILQLLKIHLGF